MNNDPFSAYGIQHLSPSTANLFIGSPAAFVLGKCLKRTSQVGAAAHRGTATETGVVHGLVTGADDAECIRIAKDEFWKLMVFSSDPAAEKEEAAVPEMVKQGLKELRPYGKPTSTQGEINYRFDEIAVPFKGFYDVKWANHNILVDLKTTHALPASVKQSHAMQVSLYCAACGNNIDGRVCYVTPKKSACYRVDNMSEHLEALKRAGMAIQRFLSVSEDPMELASLVMPDLSSFYFKDPMTRQAVWEIWKI